MLAVAGTAFWLGGIVFTALVMLVALGVFWEYRGLVRGFGGGLLWLVVGAAYVGGAGAAIIFLQGQGLFIAVLAAVIGTDIGAYFAGRTIGGPKIAPRISPSKTWAGLFGGMAGAGVMLWLTWLGVAKASVQAHAGPYLASIVTAGHAGPVLTWIVPVAVLVAITAQAGDFFESWMKRRAGVKDSGRLIPGHGGLFDRMDGLLAASLASAIPAWYALYVLFSSIRAGTSF